MNYNAIREKILKVLREEYQQGLICNLKKKNNQDNRAQFDQLSFGDITVWFFKMNCQESLSVAKEVWDLLEQKIPGKNFLKEFLEQYAEEIVLSYKAVITKNKKIQLLENMLIDTKKLLASLNNDINENSGLHEKRILIAGLQIFVDSVTGHDLDSVFSNSSLIGHQIQIGEGNEAVLSTIEGTQGAQISFNQPLPYSFPLNQLLTKIALYEVFSNNGIESKKLVGSTNINLFNTQIFYPNYASTDIIPKSQEIGLSPDQKNLSSSSLGEKMSVEDSIKLKLFVRKLQDNRNQDQKSVLNQRIQILQKKLQNQQEKSLNLKEKLLLFLHPFKESIIFSNNKININEKRQMKKINSNEKCSIF